MFFFSVGFVVFVCFALFCWLGFLWIFVYCICLFLLWGFFVGFGELFLFFIVSSSNGSEILDFLSGYVVHVKNIIAKINIGFVRGRNI